MRDDPLRCERMQFLTDFFDQAVTLPLAVCIGVAFAVSGWRRGALAWTAAAVTCWGLMLALKLGFEACGPAAGDGVLSSPSGHTASGAFAYAGLLALLAGRRAGLAGAAVLAVVIGVSRVALGAHSGPDVLAGGAVGLACVAVLPALAGPRPALSFPRWGAAFLVAPLLLLLHGTHLAAEERIQAFAHGGAFWPFTLCW